MVKNTLDYRTKVQAGLGRPKVIRKKVVIRINSTLPHRVVDQLGLTTDKPDCLIGPFPVLPAEKWKLISHVDLPTGYQLLIDIWGQTDGSSSKNTEQESLHFLNRWLITENQVRKDIQQTWASYPHTSFFFLSLNLIPPMDIIKNPINTTYFLNYLYLEGPRTPASSVPSLPDLPLVAPYDWSIRPDIVLNWQPDQVDQDLNWPIPWSIFKQTIISAYLAGDQKRRLPLIKYNLKHCRLQSQVEEAWVVSGVTTEDIQDLQRTIQEQTEKLSKLEVQSTELLSEKNQLETVHQQSDELSWQQDCQDNERKVYEQWLEKLENKKTSIQHWCQISLQQNPQDRSIQQILVYYYQHIEADEQKIRAALGRQQQNKQTNLEESTINQSEQLDELVVQLRHLGQVRLELKNQLDQNLMKICLLWFQWLQKKNNLALGLS